MAAAAAAGFPVQPERLRTDSRHRRIKIQEHQVITLQPGLVTDMTPGRGQPPPTREMLLAPRPAERADRHGVLEQHATAGPQRKTATAAASTGELQLDDAIIPGFSTRRSSRPHQSRPKAR